MTWFFVTLWLCERPIETSLVLLTYPSLQWNLSSNTWMVRLVELRALVLFLLFILQGGFHLKKEKKKYRVKRNHAERNTRVEKSTKQKPGNCKLLSLEIQFLKRIITTCHQPLERRSRTSRFLNFLNDKELKINRSRWTIPTYFKHFVSAYLS